MVKLKIALGLALALVIPQGAALHAQDDWEQMRQHTEEGRSRLPPPSIGSKNPTAKESSIGAANRTFSVCGERARPASPRVKAMVARINALSDNDFQAYQTVALEGPHAAAGGCIFYNTAVMAALMVGRLDVADSNVVEPLVWAIFAHEVGHEVHGDFSSERAGARDETKELEADRFAGYALEKLKIRATDLTPYWTMTGDEFGAGQYHHGSSQQRVAAFKLGWHLAEWDRAENSATVQSALDEPVAPDNPDSAPQ